MIEEIRVIEAILVFKEKEVWMVEMVMMVLLV